VFFERSTAEADQAVLDDLGLKPGYFLYVGSFTYRKNVLRLVEAYARLSPDHRPKLLLVGQGGICAAELRALVKAKNLRGEVLYPSAPSAVDLAVLYRHALASIYPSFFEGFGIPVLESMASGTPVIAATGSCLEETAGPGALYVNPHSTEDLFVAMRRAIEEPELLAGLREAGLRQAQRFTPHKSAASVMDVYESTLAKKK